jgi:signal peptidase I
VQPNKRVAAAGKPAAKLTARQRALRELLSWVWVVLAYLLIAGTLVEARVIPSGSMEQTVLIGDHLLVERFGYDAGVPFTSWHVSLWRQPRRQQIVVFRAPFGDSPDLIKRVIGLPGDRVEIRVGMVWVNGQPLVEPYLAGDPPAAGNFGPVTVPANDYFVLGDNRGNSYDSRFWGFVPRSDIEGTALVIYMSVDAPGEAWEPGHIGERVGAYLGSLLHPSRIRWKRLFHVF